MGGLDRLKLDFPEGLPDVVEGINIALTGARCGVEGYPISLEAVQELGDADSRRIDCIAVLRLGDQLGAFDLCFALRVYALERMPTALAFAGGILGLDDDGPAPERTFADVTFHGLPSLRTLCSSR